MRDNAADGQAIPLHGYVHEGAWQTVYMVINKRAVDQGSEPVLTVRVRLNVQDTHAIVKSNENVGEGLGHLELTHIFCRLVQQHVAL